MDIQNNLPEFSVIQAAVSGEQWAVDQIVAHYEGFINEQSMVETVQPDGSVRKCVDEELRKRPGGFGLFRTFFIFLFFVRLRMMFHHFTQKLMSQTKNFRNLDKFRQTLA